MPNELAHQMIDSGATLVFVGPSVFHTLIATLKLLKVSEEEMKKRVVIMSYTSEDILEESLQGIDQSWMRLHTLLQKGRINAPVRLTGKATDETALMCYSSGTTGLSKGVEVWTLFYSHILVIALPFLHIDHSS